MLTTFKLSLLFMLVGFSLYIFFSFLNVSTVQYHHTVTPSLSERSHPLKTVLQVNTTTEDNNAVLDAFHNFYYDPYDLYL